MKLRAVKSYLKIIMYRVEDYHITENTLIFVHFKNIDIFRTYAIYMQHSILFIFN